MKNVLKAVAGTALAACGIFGYRTYQFIKTLEPDFGIIDYDQDHEGLITPRHQQQTPDPKKNSM